MRGEGLFAFTADCKRLRSGLERSEGKCLRGLDGGRNEGASSCTLRPCWRHRWPRPVRRPCSPARAAADDDGGVRSRGPRRPRRPRPDPLRRQDLDGRQAATRSSRRSRSATARSWRPAATQVDQGAGQARAPRSSTCDGRRVLPGLIDGHIHGMREGYHCWTQVVRLDLITKRATALAMYKAKAGELADGRWIWTTSGGWNLNQLDNPTVFTFDELSAAAPKNPLWIQGQRHHRGARQPGGARRARPGARIAGRDARPRRQADRRADRTGDHAGEHGDPRPDRRDRDRRRGEVPGGLHRRGQQPRPDGVEGRRRQHGPVGDDRRDQRRSARRRGRDAPVPHQRPQRAHRLQRDEQLRGLRRASSRTRGTPSASSATTCSGTWARART